MYCMGVLISGISGNIVREIPGFRAIPKPIYILARLIGYNGNL